MKILSKLGSYTAYYKTFIYEINIVDFESRNIDGLNRSPRAVRLELRLSEICPSVDEFGTGESNDQYRQCENEELYVVLMAVSKWGWKERRSL